MNTLLRLTVGALVGWQLLIPAYADSGEFYVAPGLQWMNFDNGTGLDNDTGYALGLGYGITERLSAEINGFDLDPDRRGGTDEEIDHWKVSMLYDWPGDLFGTQPFVTAGVGNMNFDGDNDTSFDFGAGLKYRLSDNWEWQTTIRSFRYLGRDFEDGDFGIDSRLVFYFGGRREPVRLTPVQRPVTAAPVPDEAPADADRDGVPDSEDLCPDTPPNYAVDDDGCPIPVEEVARIELLVNFDFDRTTVKPEFFSEIERVVSFMRQYPDTIAELEGHADAIGTIEYNQGLSERRARAVRQVMIDEFEMEAGRIFTRGFGELQPVASNETDSGRAQNRRVVTVIIKTLSRFRTRDEQ